MYQKGFNQFFQEFGDFDCHLEDFKRKNDRIEQLKNQLIMRDDEINNHAESFAEIFTVNKSNREEIKEN